MTPSEIKLEKHFESLLMSACTNTGYHVVPLPDDCKIMAGSGARVQARAKPYDFGLCINGKYLAVECKLVKGEMLYGHDIRDCQHEGLTSVAKAGGIPLLAVYFMFKRKMPKPLNSFQIFRQAFFVDYRKHLDGKPTISYNQLVEASTSKEPGRDMLDPLNSFIPVFEKSFVVDHLRRFDSE